MTKIKPLLIAASLMMGLALPATAQIGEPRQNFSVGFNGGVNLNSASFTPKIKQKLIDGYYRRFDGTLHFRKVFCNDLWCASRVKYLTARAG